MACNGVRMPLSQALLVNPCATDDACLHDWFSTCKQVLPMMRAVCERVEKEVPGMQALFSADNHSTVPQDREGRLIERMGEDAIRGWVLKGYAIYARCLLL